MPDFGKPDVTGRSSGKLNGRAGRNAKPPPGEPWIWLTREFLRSPAYRSLGVNARRLLDFLHIEHMSHAGRENGKLPAPYDQLEEFGLSRRLIHEAIEELVAAGIVRVEQRGGQFDGARTCSLFRLTLYPDHEGRAPTNEWKRVTAEQIKAAAGTRKQKKLKRAEWKKKNRVHESEPVKCTRVNPSMTARQ